MLLLLLAGGGGGPVKAFGATAFTLALNSRTDTTVANPAAGATNDAYDATGDTD